MSGSANGGIGSGITEFVTISKARSSSCTSCGIAERSIGASLPNTFHIGLGLGLGAWDMKRLALLRLGSLMWVVLANLILPAQSAVPSFDRSYVYDGFRVRVAEGTEETRSIGTYTITLTAPDGRATIVKADREGTIQDAWVKDLKATGSLDVVIAIQSVGSGSYGALIIYQWAGDSLKPIKVAELSPVQTQGYRGHDVFGLDGRLIVRTFPIYRSNDPNALPSGGIRRLVYDFRNNRWISDWRRMSRPSSMSLRGSSSLARWWSTSTGHRPASCWRPHAASLPVRPSSSLPEFTYPVKTFRDHRTLYTRSDDPLV